MIDDEDELSWPDESELRHLTMPGTAIGGRYKIERQLGEGGMGSVYLANDDILGRPVAIKMVKAGQSAQQNAGRFLREATSLAKLNHPNIVTIFDFGWHGEQAYLVMEYIPGSGLDSLLAGSAKGVAAGQGLTIGQALDVAIKVTTALSYAHRHGVIHRDIKPGNIIIGDEVKLMDFGIAKMRESPSITMEGARIGTPLYMAPEQVMGKNVDTRSDVYSLGVVLYEMFTGRPPFSATDETSILSQHVQVSPVAPGLRNSAIPKSLDSLILRMLAKDPNGRPASAEQLLSELEAVRRELPAAVCEATTARKEVASCDRSNLDMLRNIPLFASIGADDLAELSNKLVARRYRKSETVFHKDDHGSTLHIITKGLVKISMPSASGGEEEVVLASLRPGDFFGELALLDENPRSATATAVEPLETLALERKDFLEFLKWYPEAAVRILGVLAQRLRNLNSQLEALVLSSPVSRLAETLLKVSRTHGKETPEGRELDLPLTIDELAGAAGLTPDRARRLLRNLEKSGVIGVRNRHYVIQKPSELQKLVTRRG